MLHVTRYTIIFQFIDRNMIELIVLIVLLAIVLVLIHTGVIEGFEDKPATTVDKPVTTVIKPLADDPDFHLIACPTGFSTYYNSKGDVMCCDGEVSNGVCPTGKQCTLSSSAVGDIPTCVSLLRSQYAAKAKEQCPPSMPSYYESKTTKAKGCTAGRLAATLDGPLHPSEPTCVIYPTLEENLNAKDSCYMQRKREEFPCFGKDCRTEVIQVNATSPAQIAVHFTDPDGLFHIAYTRESMEHYLNVTNPKWRDQGIDLDKNIHVAEVAKAYYIDKTIKDVQV